VAQSLSPIGERLGVPQPKRPRVPTARLNPAHAAKAMHSNVMFADRLSGLRARDTIVRHAANRAGFAIGKEWQGTSWAPPDLIQIRSKGVCGDNQRECAVRNLFGSSQHHQYESITAAVRSRACRNLWIAAYARLALAIRNSKQSRSVRRMCHQFA
jgi:hypothetical protein